ncbi:MAG: hypothetical protein WCL60_07955 [Methylococcales bacterium]
MKYEKNDVNELYESINVDANFYVEIKENEYLTKIKNKWLLINEIVSFVNENPSNYNNNRTA